jgi:methionine-rich copper-binding protein CopC
MKHRRIVAALLAGILPTGSGIAVAHDLVRRSEPAADAVVVAGRPVPVAVVYSGRIDRARSRLLLVAPDGTRRELALAGLSPPNVLEASVPIVLTPGAYALRWIVLSSDGHLTRGDIPFRVVPPGGPGSAPNPGR